MNYINCDCITEVNQATEVNLTLDTNTGKYYLEGISTQTGTPSPNDPKEIVHTYKAGHYKTTINNTTYYFNLGDDLRSIETLKDKFWLDTSNISAYVEKVVKEVIVDETSNIGDTTTYFSLRTPGHSPSTANLKSSHFPYGRNTSPGIWAGSTAIAINKWGDINTLEEFKSWLENNNVVFDFELETPTIESVEVD